MKPAVSFSTPSACSFPNSTLRCGRIVHYELGEYEEADEIYREVLAWRREFFGPDHFSVATTKQWMADLAEARGNFPEAQALHEETLAIRRRGLGESHPMVAASLYNLGMLHRRHGDFMTAESFLSQATTHTRMHLGRTPDPEDLLALAHVRLELGAFSEALPLCLELAELEAGAFSSASQAEEARALLERCRQHERPGAATLKHDVR